MTEPHQRVQSGKLRRPIRYSISDSTDNRRHSVESIPPGIENSTELQSNDWDDDILVYQQTPGPLTDLHLSILRRVASGYGITDDSCIDRYWRRTWNIGTWTIKDKLSISINIMQPNIANCWAIVSDIDRKTVEDAALQFEQLQLPNSSCKISGVNTIMIQGRWTLHLITKLIADNHITIDQVNITYVNITQSRIFCWLILSSDSEYLCTLTKDSIEILVKYLPDWCTDIVETNAANNRTLRIKQPSNSNDASQLSISTTGNIQYTGKPHSVDKLPEALSIAINSTIHSPFLKFFLRSLQYKKV